MLARLMLNPVRRGAGRCLTAMSAFVLGTAVLPSPAAAQAAGEAIPYFIADGTGVPGYQPSDGELARAAFEAWARESAGRLRFVEAGEADALIHLIWIAPGSGLYGEMRRVIIDDRPRAFVYVTPAIDGQGPDIARLAARDPLLRDTIVYLTCVHELGHAVGLPHTAEFDDIMYSFAFGGDIVRYFMRYRDKLDSRADIMNHSGLSPGDRAVLHSLYPLQGRRARGFRGYYCGTGTSTDPTEVLGSGIGSPSPWRASRWNTTASWINCSAVSYESAAATHPGRSGT